MSVWKVQGFGGMVPALDARLLAETAATFAQNCLLKTGSIQALPEPQHLHNLQPQTSFVYRFPSSYADASFIYDSTWLEFDDPDTCVIRAPTIDDQFDRYYFVSPQVPPRYNTKARIDAGQPPWLLGVPAPLIAPVVDSTGGVEEVLETRSYVYTWVTVFNEEGPPSPPTLDTDKIDATWRITVTPPPASDIAPGGTDRQIDRVRIYRSVTTEDGTPAVSHRVVELPIGTTVYDDILTGQVVSLNPVLESTSWGPPPTDLHGFILSPNGFLVGWRGNQFSEIHFSEPFRPHAWPAEYTQVVEYPVVGLGITNQTIVCCTESYPVSLSGVHPKFMEINKLVNHEPCMSRGSILSGPEGVFYASPNGLVLVVPGLAENVTKGIISKRNWQLLLNVPRLRAARLGMAYFAYGSVQIGVFQDGPPDPAQVPVPPPYLPTGFNAFQTDAFATEDQTGSLVGVVIDPTSDRVAFSMLKSEIPIDNCYNDPWSGEVLIVSGGAVRWLDIVSSTVQYHTYLWSSKVWQTSDWRNVSACKVFWDGQLGFGPRTTNLKNEIRFYAKGGNFPEDTLVLTRQLEISGEPFRLPSGYKADYIRFEIESSMRVHTVQFATTMKELASV